MAEDLFFAYNLSSNSDGFNTGTLLFLKSRILRVTMKSALILSAQHICTASSKSEVSISEAFFKSEDFRSATSKIIIICSISCCVLSGVSSLRRIYTIFGTDRAEIQPLICFTSQYFHTFEESSAKSGRLQSTSRITLVSISIFTFFTPFCTDSLIVIIVFQDTSERIRKKRNT